MRTETGEFHIGEPERTRNKEPVTVTRTDVATMPLFVVNVML
jgi:hypothetical protein